MRDLVQCLNEAIGKEYNQLSNENPFYISGFDGGKRRLGWARAVDFNLIKNSLVAIDEILYPFKTFIFVGMGGSVNGMKPVLSLFKDHSIHTIDSLDPQAIIELKDKIKDFSKTCVIPISKSGTTKETQSISNALKELFGADWRKHYMILADPGAFSKLDSLGWDGVKKFSIQFDGDEDIGGRFSCPQTAIFFLPLYLLLGKDLNKVQAVYNNYLSLRNDICSQAASLAEKYKNQTPAYFTPVVKDSMKEVFASWLYQLFQESIGSKKDGLATKTIVIKEKGHEGFIDLPLVMHIDDSIVYVMAHMYFFQCFVAFYSAHQKLNFVNQEVVEKYKAQMRKLEGQKIEGIETLNLTATIERTKKLAANYRYIDVVLYFYPSDCIIKEVKKQFAAAFPDKNIIVVIGSDWNHHSYQATFGDKETFFLLLLAADFKSDVPGISSDMLKKNIETLKIISKATYLTMTEKSVLLALE
jgi:hypothetical protein